MCKNKFGWSVDPAESYNLLSGFILNTKLLYIVNMLLEYTNGTPSIIINYVVYFGLICGFQNNILIRFLQ